MEERIGKVQEIYRRFAGESAPWREKAACEKGCAYCCTDAGAVDITTLEGLVIRERIFGMPRARRTALKKALDREMRKREAGIVVPCPFLMKNRACMIYEVRPFACRRIYSLHRCSGKNPPRLHRQVMEMAAAAIRDLQRLDENGYSGHISYILHMLDAPRFLATYRAGGFRPEEVVDFGRTHGIVIHRTVA